MEPRPRPRPDASDADDAAEAPRAVSQRELARAVKTRDLADSVAAAAAAAEADIAGRLLRGARMQRGRYRATVSRVCVDADFSAVRVLLGIFDREA